MYPVTIFLSAFLLFLVQPLLAKQLLPWFGGSAAVWTTCMLFFQSLLLGGYAYAHWLASRPTPRTQLRIHGGLVLLSLGALWFSDALASAPAPQANPIAGILWLLSIYIGLPYLVLSSTGPLLQSWYARARPQGAPYRLYALSNIGSFLGLLSYPLLLEPLLPRQTISALWRSLYVLFALAILLITRQFTRAQPAAPSALRQRDDQPELKPSWRAALYWILLAAAASVLLLSATAHLTQDVASIPFLWVLPLAVYLLSFVLAFDRESWYRPVIFIPLALAGTLLLSVALTSRLDRDLLDAVRNLARHPFAASFWTDSTLIPASQAIPLYVLGVFVLCWFCNGELVRSKPPIRYLTWFYLLIAAGGALGAVIVSIVGPMLLPGFYEFPVVLAALAALCVVRSRGAVWKLVAALPALLVLVFALRYATVVRNQTIAVVRDFYGLFRVEQAGSAAAGNLVRYFLSGVILHGDQRLSPQLRRVPTEYYAASSGIGRTLQLLTQPRLRVGLIGLGAGTLAAYGRDGDSYHFYEINPDVLHIARTSFSYLTDSRARIEVSLGDARLSLSRQPTERFDLLVVDAFSSDSIPVHLLTREAMLEYTRHVGPEGVIAFDLTNRELALMPVVQDLADSVNRRAVLVSDDPSDSEETGIDVASSDWMLITNNPTLLAALQSTSDAQTLRAEPRLRPWTDNYSSLLQVWRPFRRLTGRPDY